MQKPGQLTWSFIIILTHLLWVESISSPWVQAEDKAPAPMRSKPHPEEQEIPSRPTIPSLPLYKKPHEFFRCPRYFSYRGKEFGCDSALRKDGEGLRSILAASPEAIEALDLYQSNLNALDRFAYASTGGLLLILLAPTVGKRFEGDTENWVRNISTLSGATLVVGSAFFGFSFLRKNESNLQIAIDRYNQQFPGDRIELKFSTSFISF
jgi:hypothetical protein